MNQFAVDLYGLKFEHPIMNAAGTCKTLEDVEKLARSAVSAIMVGSITVEQRDGNSGEVFAHNPLFSLNSLGLPNPGLVYYQEHLPAMRKLVHGAGKQLIVSVAGFSPGQYARLAKEVCSCADLIELNLGCPNVWDGGRQKRIASFDCALIREILNEVAAWIHLTPIVVKFSPFSDPHQLELAVQAVTRYPIVRAITATNTFPNSFAIHHDGRQLIDPGGGLAGMAGPALKPIALGQVAQISRMPAAKGLAIAGVGGVETGQDVLDYLRSGAQVVQIATAYLRKENKENPAVFSRILSEFVDLVEVAAI